VKNPVIGGGKGGGWGAWQIAGRYDVIDLTDQATTIQGNPTIATGGNFLQALSTNCTQCGEQKTWEVVLNWWLNDYTGLQFQYSESDIEGGPLFFTNAAGALVSANVNDGAKIRGFGTRMRFDW
jgi:phosphate-selective porin OprO/OprP